MAYTLLILGHHVITHNLDMTAIRLLEKFANNMGFRIKSYTMVNFGVCVEELFEYAVILLMLLIEGQIHSQNNNLPVAAALSAVLMAIILVSMLILNRFTETEEGGSMLI